MSTNISENGNSPENVAIALEEECCNGDVPAIAEEDCEENDAIHNVNVEKESIHESIMEIDETTLTPLPNNVQPTNIKTKNLHHNIPNEIGNIEPYDTMNITTTEGLQTPTKKVPKKRTYEELVWTPEHECRQPTNHIWEEFDNGKSAEEITRQHGVSKASLYKWRQRYGGLEATELKRIKELEEEKVN